VVSAGQAKDKEKVDPFPGPAGSRYRPDRATARAALAFYREKQPRLLHVGLGDTDEHGHRGSSRGYFESLREADGIVGELMEAVEAAGHASTTTFLVTTDHGRAANLRYHGPGIAAASRSFVIGFGGGVRAAGVACAKREHTLADVGATVRALLELPPDPSSNAGRRIDEIAAR
jgi:phosphopentomutase